MPELILEYTHNIVEKDNFSDLFAKLHKVMVEILPANLSGCLSRAVEIDHYYIGDGDSDNAFVHLQLSVKQGRSQDVLDKVAHSMKEILDKHFFTSAKKRNLKITLEVREMEVYLY
jgi:5-carboxymethyl-2-hydroxymuconate isomerase